MVRMPDRELRRDIRRGDVDARRDAGAGRGRGAARPRRARCAPTPRRTGSTSCPTSTWRRSPGWCARSRRTSTWPTSPSRCIAAARSAGCARRRAAGSSRRSARIAKAGVDADVVAEILRHVTLRPVFTAHPTEVARRSTIDKLRQVAALLEEPESSRRTRRLEEAVELLWLTDEIRVEPPGADGRGAQRRLLPRGAVRCGAGRTCSRSSATSSPVSGSSCRRTCGRCASAAGSVATATATRTSHRRPPARCSRSRPSTASGCCAASSTGCVATSR